MRMYDIIAKKRDGGALDDAEIAYVVSGYTADEIPDYQVAAFLMAVFFRGMTAHETAVLTKCMAESGDMIDLSPIKGVKADKHSTGGVGDKTTLVAAPLAAACGVKVAKMSGRGLGHTGGTVDKMEAIPGMRVTLSREEFFAQVNDIGIAVVGQSGNLAPADKKLYALRDVTATVNSIPLIASSIMSKKLAAGSDAIVLDVKTGSGAFMKSTEESIDLAREMVAIGEANGRRTAAIITDMDTPLGLNIGNRLEVIEAVSTLHGTGPADLTAVSLELACGMLMMAGLGTHAECMARVRRALEDGSGFEKLRQMVAAQGGDVRAIDDPDDPFIFPPAGLVHEVKAPRGGYMAHMDTERVGVAAMLLGAGRETKDDTIDYAAGISLMAKPGDEVRAGQPIALLHTSTPERCRAGEKTFLEALSFADGPPPAAPLVLARVGKDGVTRF